MFSYTQFIITDETYFMLDLEQKFPWFGTRAVRREKAAAEATSRRAERLARKDRGRSWVELLTS